MPCPKRQVRFGYGTWGCSFDWTMAVGHWAPAVSTNPQYIVACAISGQQLLAECCRAVSVSLSTIAKRFVQSHHR